MKQQRTTIYIPPLYEKQQRTTSTSLSYETTEDHNLCKYVPPLYEKQEQRITIYNHPTSGCVFVIPACDRSLNMGNTGRQKNIFYLL